MRRVLLRWLRDPVVGQLERHIESLLDELGEAYVTVARLERERQDGKP